VRRGAIVRLVVLGIVLGLGATAVAILIPWLPDSASDQAEEIDFVFWFVTAICIMVFSVVASVAVYSVLKFRAPPDDDAEGLPIHGHTGIEIAWTVVPFMLVTAMGIVSAVALARNEKVPDDASSAASSRGSSCIRRRTHRTQERTGSSATPRRCGRAV
jgi:cytochrome c oxidase subunit 2